MNRIQQIQNECWVKLTHCLGTSYIFGEKAKKIKIFLKSISILGIVVPVLIGGVAATYGANSEYLIWALIITGPITITQLILSVLSLVLKQEDKLAYAMESQTDNRVLYEEYKRLAQNPLATAQAMQTTFDLINAKDQARTTQDEKYTFTERENRKGMRYALKITQRPCATCHKTPTNMTPSNCETCGNF